MGRCGTRALLSGTLALAAALRLYGLNWDDFHQLHPDERAITLVAAQLALPLPPQWANLLDPVASTLNPHFFAYGSATFYLLRLGSWAAALLEPAWGGLEYVNLVGRALSAGADVATVALVHAIGGRLYGRSTGLVAAALATFAVLHIQQAHFYTADTLLTLTVMLALFLAARALSGRGLDGAWQLGGALGLALAFKISAAPALLLPPVVALLRELWLADRPRPRLGGQLPAGGVDASSSPVGHGYCVKPYGEAARRVAGFTSAGLLAALLVAVVLQPYAALDGGEYLAAVMEQVALARGQWEVPYTLQFAGTPPYLYFARNLVAYGFGPVLGLTALAGTAYVALRQLRRPRAADLLLLAWAVPYGVLVGGLYTKYTRYLLPLTPVLCLFAAVALVELPRRLAARLNGPALAAAPAALVLAASAVHALSFMNVYVQEHPRLAASRWLYANLPAGAVLTRERWDDALPLPLAVAGVVRSPDEFGAVEMDLYGPDDEAKVTHLAQSLALADYVVLSSDRAHGAVVRSPQRFPVSNRYYELLFAGELGFVLERAFAVYPALAGWQGVDEGADESFTVYDHPKVLVFRKVVELSEAELRTRLAPLGPPATGAPLEGLSDRLHPREVAPVAQIGPWPLDADKWTRQGAEDRGTPYAGDRTNVEPFDPSVQRLLRPDAEGRFGDRARRVSTAGALPAARPGEI